MNNVFFEWTVPSFTAERAHAGIEYSVRLFDDGVMVCSCPAFINSVTTDCKHIKAVRQGRYNPDPASEPVSDNGLEKSNVRNLGKTTETTKLFRYDGMWRVQFTKVTNDQANSRLLTSYDNLYGSYSTALTEFNMFASA